VPFLFFAAIALIGAAIHARRERGNGHARTLEIFLVWWMVVAVGVAAIFGAMFHLFDGPHTAREIGYSNGDGGFQTEVGFADLAIGILGVLCARFRDGFLLAAVIAVSVSYLGDAYGHLHQEAIHDNHDPDNTGLLLWSDFIVPLVAIALYAAWQRLRKSGNGREPSTTAG
jgi:NADH:ubiquinone oxidoreductase subunit 6 (subunit J)